jgi:hypothetical protein
MRNVVIKHLVAVSLPDKENKAIDYNLFQHVRASEMMMMMMTMTMVVVVVLEGLCRC